jgi:hypothetical protein
MGRIQIKSIENLVTKVDQKSRIDQAAIDGKKKYLEEKNNSFNKLSLKGLGVVD